MYATTIHYQYNAITINVMVFMSRKCPLTEQQKDAIADSIAELFFEMWKHHIENESNRQSDNEDQQA